MAILGISARGETVDFDILKIRQQLASKPVTVGVDARRQFIDGKDGIKPKAELRNGLITTPAEVETITAPDLGDMLAVDVESAN
jgi:hypothetical protein